MLREKVARIALRLANLPPCLIGIEAGMATHYVACENPWHGGADKNDAPRWTILIYTASGDSEGTLGGLVRQGEADATLDQLNRVIYARSFSKTLSEVQQSIRAKPCPQDMAAHEPAPRR